jgi:hypothetical protein
MRLKSPGFIQPLSLYKVKNRFQKPLGLFKRNVYRYAQSQYTFRSGGALHVGIKLTHSP